ncbi:FUSC family protein [Streptomyces gamaensis]|uniref:FUSC family protein n=1 Tax=Streptomyces gamaensis TaxID=1763542 RepID=A0ABW0ZDE4_9ACTN
MSSAWPVLRGVVSVLLAVMTGLLFDSVAAAVLLAVGAFIVTMQTLGEKLHHPAVVALGVSVSLAFCAALGGLVGTHDALHLATLAVVGFVAGLAWSGGASAGMVAAASVIGFLVVGDLASGPVVGLEMAGLLLSGGLLQVVTQLLPPWRGRFAAQRTALGTVYGALADHASALVGNPGHFSSDSPFYQAHRALRVLRGRRRQQAAALYGLLAQAEQFRFDLGSIAQAPPTGDGAARAAVLRIVHDGLRAIGHAVEYDQPYELPEFIPRILEAEAERNPPLAAVGSTAGSFRVAARLTQPQAGQRALPDMAAALGRPPVRALLQWELGRYSPVLRHALRLAAALTLAELTGRWAGNWGGHGILDHGFWVSLTTVLVLRPQFATTLQQGWARGLGAVVGALGASGLYLLAAPGPEAALAVMEVCAVSAFLTRASGTALMSLWITAFVVLAITALGYAEPEAAWSRAVATVVGCGIAMLSYLLWPTWHRDVYPRLLARWTAAQQTQLALLCRAWANPGTLDRAALAKARLEVLAAFVLLESAASYIADEPARHGHWTPRTVTEIVACTHHIAHQVDTLEARLPGPEEPGTEEAATLGTALHTALSLAPTGRLGLFNGERLDAACRQVTHAATSQGPEATERAETAARIASAVVELRTLVARELSTGPS